jgi:class 3 adenylate cyclase
MFTDMVGFSRQIGTDEARTLRLLATHNQIIEQTVATHQGHIIKTAGDGFLIEFPSIGCPTKIRRCWSAFLPPCARRGCGES